MRAALASNSLVAAEYSSASGWSGGRGGVDATEVVADAGSASECVAVSSWGVGELLCCGVGRLWGEISTAMSCFGGVDDDGGDGERERLRFAGVTVAEASAGVSVVLSVRRTRRTEVVGVVLLLVGRCLRLW